MHLKDSYRNIYISFIKIYEYFLTLHRLYRQVFQYTLWKSRHTGLILENFYCFFSKITILVCNESVAIGFSVMFTNT